MHVRRKCSSGFVGWPMWHSHVALHQIDRLITSSDSSPARALTQAHLASWALPLNQHAG